MVFAARNQLSRAFLLAVLTVLLIWTNQAKADTKLFTDVADDHWAADAIKWAHQHQVVTGYSDGTFQPNRHVSEAEFVTMLFRAFNVAAPSEAADTHWSDSVYRKVAEFNYPVKGMENVSVRNQPLNRLAVAEIVVGANGENYEGDHAIHYLLAHGLSKGKSSATIAGYEGDKLLTRAEAVQFIKNLIDSGMTELKERPAAPSDPAKLPPLKADIVGETHIILDYDYGAVQRFQYRLSNGDKNVVWSLKFPYDIHLPLWENSRIDYETNEEIRHGVHMDPDTGELTIGWYLWITEFDVVATSKADGSVVASQTVRISYSNIDRIVATNGAVTLEFLEEPDWYEYEWNGEIHRYDMNVNDVVLMIENDGKYTDIPATYRYDEDTNSVTFFFEPFEPTDEEQIIVIHLGYRESTYISPTVIVVPAKSDE